MTPRMRMRAKEAWEWAKHRDDVTERSARERRLLSALGARRSRERRARLAIAFAAALALVVVVGRWAFVRGQDSVAVTVPAAGVAPSATAAQGSAPTVASSPPIPATGAATNAAPVATSGLVVTDVRGPTTRSGAPVRAGDAILSGDDLDVPRGAFLHLAWLVGSNATMDVDIEGPSFVHVERGGATPLLSVRRGSMHVSSGSPRIVRDVGAGGDAEVASDGRVTVHAAPSTPADAAELWRAAQAALDRGDRPAAEASLRALLVQGGDAGLRGRAELRLSELLLARGASTEARAHLEPLVLGPSRALAGEAVWLYVRTFRAPRDRAQAWRRYLETSPASPMRELATIDLANALFDAGDGATARALTDELRARSLAPVATEALRRLDRRLGIGAPPGTP